MGLFDSVFGGGKEAAAKEARKGVQRGMEAAKKYEGSAEQSFSPYTSSAQDILNQYRQALGQGADPGAFINQLMGQYQMSPQVQAQIDAGTRAANAAAAAGGMLGSSGTQQNIASYAQGLRSQDLQNFLNNALGIRSQYLGGLGGLEQQGFTSAEDLANLREQLAQQMMQGEQYKGQLRGAQKMAHGGMLGGLMGAGLGIAGSLFGMPQLGMIGSSLFGSQLGNQLGGSLGGMFRQAAGPGFAEGTGASYIPGIPRF